MKSKVFKDFFQANHKNKIPVEEQDKDEYQEDFEDNLIEGFYSIEEYSMFSTNDSSSQKRIIHKDRKVKQIRKLSQCEVLMIILNNLKVTKPVQNVEVKFQSEVLKKITLLNSLTFDKQLENQIKADVS